MLFPRKFTFHNFKDNTVDVLFKKYVCFDSVKRFSYVVDYFVFAGFNPFHLFLGWVFLIQKTVIWHVETFTINDTLSEQSDKKRLKFVSLLSLHAPPPPVSSFQDRDIEHILCSFSVYFHTCEIVCLILVGVLSLQPSSDDGCQR